MKGLTCPRAKCRPAWARGESTTTRISHKISIRELSINTSCDALYRSLWPIWPTRWLTQRSGWLLRVKTLIQENMEGGKNDNLNRKWDWNHTHAKWKWSYSDNVTSAHPLPSQTPPLKSSVTLHWRQTSTYSSVCRKYQCAVQSS